MRFGQKRRFLTPTITNEEQLNEARKDLVGLSNLLSLYGEQLSGTFQNNKAGEALHEAAVYSKKITETPTPSESHPLLFIPRLFYVNTALPFDARGAQRGFNELLETKVLGRDGKCPLLAHWKETMAGSLRPYGAETFFEQYAADLRNLYNEKAFNTGDPLNPDHTLFSEGTIKRW